MEFSIEFIKKIISIFCTGLILLTFIITTISTNKNSPNYIEYTDLSKFFLNLYIFIILTLIFCHTINPKIICSIFTNKFSFIITENGKLILLSIIILMYFGTGNSPQKAFGMISFFALFGLLISKYCRSFRKNELIEEKMSNNSSQANVTTSQAFN